VPLRSGGHNSEKCHLATAFQVITKNTRSSGETTHEMGSLVNAKQDSSFPSCSLLVRITCPFALFIGLSAPCFAQSEGLNDLDYRSMISDLNAVAPRLTNERLSNSDVAMVAAIGCSTARVGLRNGYSAKIGPFIRSNYPSQDTLAKIDIGTFIRSEDLILQKVGATQAARVLVQQTIKAAPNLPTTPPSDNASLESGLRRLEKDACSMREAAVTAPAEPAPESQSRFARCVGRAIVGMGVIVADAFAVAATLELPVAATIIAAISSGWGWNRVEEGCS